MKKLSLSVFVMCLYTNFLSASAEAVPVGQPNQSALVLSPRTAAGAAAAFATLATAHLPSDVAFFAAGVVAPTVLKRVTGHSPAENAREVLRMIMTGSRVQSEPLTAGENSQSGVAAMGNNALVNALSALTTNRGAVISQLKTAALSPQGKKAATYVLAGTIGTGVIWWMLGDAIKRYGGAAVVGLGTFYWVSDVLAAEDTTANKTSEVD